MIDEQNRTAHFTGYSCLSLVLSGDLRAKYNLNPFVVNYLAAPLRPR
ncbi:hypothetical protein GPLA_1089 [Paraglaciecola polaris LMG 21857]|uniref:Uncharacterized protein n=1 Tax=Paraglaciecola polaris LMG 21857 TaxID=1129793 RepID=K6YGZ2_9ALTE|nr:hypothetical protein GPLA_1089 [Paraglaciecola polaris LMG 21857]